MCVILEHWLRLSDEAPAKIQKSGAHCTTMSYIKS